ncbi:MAG TPA: hypothetical protein VIC55_06175 [Gemmatimonadaceae bacterium]
MAVLVDNIVYYIARFRESCPIDFSRRPAARGPAERSARLARSKAPAALCDVNFPDGIAHFRKGMLRPLTVTTVASALDAGGKPHVMRGNGSAAQHSIGRFAIRHADPDDRLRTSRRASSAITAPHRSITLDGSASS